VKTADSKELKILFPGLFSPGPKVSQKIFHTPVGQKSGRRYIFLKDAIFGQGHP
jgi:hypothetical protein